MQQAPYEGWPLLQRGHGPADIVRRDRAREPDITVSLSTVRRGEAPLRRNVRTQAVAAVRYETAPGQRLQIDFGSTVATISIEQPHPTGPRHGVCDARCNAHRRRSL